MILAIGGRRVDQTDAEVSRFPQANVDMVQEQLRHIFDQYTPSAVVASAAAGADLLGLEEAVARSIPHRVILPFATDRFRASSVTDVPGEWGKRFDAVHASAARTDNVVIHPSPSADEEEADAYRRAADAVLDEALLLAERELDAQGKDAPAETDVIALVIWEGAPRGPDDFTAYFKEGARKRNIKVVEVLTR